MAAPSPITPLARQRILVIQQAGVVHAGGNPRPQGHLHTVHCDAGRRVRGCLAQTCMTEGISGRRNREDISSRTFKIRLLSRLCVHFKDMHTAHSVLLPDTTPGYKSSSRGACLPDFSKSSASPPSPDHIFTEPKSKACTSAQQAEALNHQVARAPACLDNPGSTWSGDVPWHRS